MGRKKKEDTEEIIKKPKAIGPFDIINMMFTNKASFDSLSNLLLEKNFFMINRIFAIQFPLQAQYFNKLTINNANVIRCWANFAVSKLGYGRVPSFVYTKGAKKTNDLSSEEISKDTKEIYCNFYKISFKDLEDMLYFNHDNTIAHINQFLKNKKSDDQIQKIKN